MHAILLPRAALWATMTRWISPDALRGSETESPGRGERNASPARAENRSSNVDASDWKDFDAIGEAERSRRSTSDGHSIARDNPSVAWGAEESVGSSSADLEGEVHARQPSAEISDASAGAMFQYSRHMRVKATIAKDLERTQVSNAYFHRAHVREMMSRVLLTWALSNPDIGYHQGMNEILAIILLVLHGDCDAQSDIRGAESLDEAMRAAVCPEFIENDAYDLFSRIMERMCSIFSPSSRPSTPLPAVDAEDGDQEEETRGKSLVDRLSHIQHVLLQRTDPVLAAARTFRGSRMYLVRWVKVMLTREYAAPGSSSCGCHFCCAI